MNGALSIRQIVAEESLAELVFLIFLESFLLGPRQRLAQPLTVIKYNKLVDRTLQVNLFSYASFKTSLSPP